MSATNKTTNYEFPVFIGTDKPAWLVDWNGAMNLIDTAIKQAETKADQAGTDVGSIQSDIITINSSITTLNNAVSQLRIDTNANTGAINTIQELIGNGTPTTTDHTIIGAINEINAKVLDFTFSQHNVAVASSNITVASSTNVNCLLNVNKKVGKIYGFIAGPVTQAITSSNNIVATLTITGLNTTEAYTVEGYMASRYASGVTSNNTARLRFNVGNTVDILCNVANVGDDITISLPPCLLFLEDLGD